MQNGFSTRVRYAICIDDSCFQNRSMRVYTLEVDKDYLVSDRIDHGY